MSFFFVNCENIDCSHKNKLTFYDTIKGKYYCKDCILFKNDNSYSFFYYVNTINPKDSLFEINKLLNCRINDFFKEVLFVDTNIDNNSESSMVFFEDKNKVKVKFVKNKRIFYTSLEELYRKYEKNNIKIVEQNNSHQLLLKEYKQNKYKNEKIYLLYSKLFQNENNLLLNYYSDYIFQYHLLDFFVENLIRNQKNSTNKFIVNFCVKTLNNISLFKKTNFNLDILKDL